MKPANIAVLLTCYNRREKTLECLQALHQQTIPEACQLHVYLVDDGSTDGTAEAVQNCYPDVSIRKGDGSLFWNGGMRCAFHAAEEIDPDYYLWLNDDTVLDPSALTTLLNSLAELNSQGSDRAIVVGSTLDPDTHIPTYGGVKQTYWWHPVKFHYIEPDPKQVKGCDTFHGNCVLVPRLVANLVGNLSAAYTHNLGDYDYGLRARRQGCTLWMAPGYVGTCSGNPHVARMVQADLMGSSWQKLDRPKGFALADVTLHSPKEWKDFCQENSGLLWYLYWLFPYRRLLWLQMVKQLSFRRANKSRVDS
jgi:GT2 family glycosyltransferase